MTKHPCVILLLQVAHMLRLVSFFALQLPIFTYLITQFQVCGLCSYYDSIRELCSAQQMS